MVWLPVFGIFKVPQVLINAIAFGGCSNTVRDSGRKKTCRTGDSNPRQYCVWLFSRTLYQLSYPGPLSLGLRQRMNVCGGGPFHRLKAEKECLWGKPVPQAQGREGMSVAEARSTGSRQRRNVCEGGPFHRLKAEKECLWGRPVPQAKAERKQE